MIQEMNSSKTHGDDQEKDKEFKGTIEANQKIGTTLEEEPITARAKGQDYRGCLRGTIDGVTSYISYAESVC